MFIVRVKGDTESHNHQSGVVAVLGCCVYTNSILDKLSPIYSTKSGLTAVAVPKIHRAAIMAAGTKERQRVDETASPTRRMYWKEGREGRRERRKKEERREKTGKEKKRVCF